jgi:hypothetical protein
MRIEAYANTQDGYHVCLNCITPSEEKTFTPLYHSDLWDYTYADFDLGCSDSPNFPSCDRCLEEIEFQSPEDKARTIVSIMGRHLGKEVAEETEDLDGFQETFTQYSSWANEYLPTFRKLAGYTDNGAGTYTVSDSDDPFYLMIDIEDAFWAGVYQGFEKRRKSLESLNTNDE